MEGFSIKLGSLTETERLVVDCVVMIQAYRGDRALCLKHIKQHQDILTAQLQNSKEVDDETLDSFIWNGKRIEFIERCTE